MYFLSKDDDNPSIWVTKEEYLDYPDNYIVYRTRTEWENEVELRSMKQFIHIFGDLNLYGCEYSSFERMEIYAPEMFI
jgi:hypothetical protein